MRRWAVFYWTQSAVTRNDIVTFSYYHDQVDRSFLDRCEQDEACLERISNATAKLQKVYDYLNGGITDHPCAEFLDGLEVEFPSRTDLRRAIQQRLGIFTRSAT